MSTRPADQNLGWRKRLRAWRRNNRRRMNRTLARLFGTTAPRRAPLDADTQRILVVRFNRRLGNILFLTPMLHALARHLPDARIDIVVQDPAHRVLLQTLPGVDRVWIQERNLFSIIALWRSLRAARYDLAIDPHANSASNRVAIALCGARQRLGFSAKDQWVALTHAAPKPKARHQARQGMELLAGGIDGFELPETTVLELPITDAAERAATTHWQQALPGLAHGTTVVGFFAQATGAKELPQQWWRDWAQAVHEQNDRIQLLQIMPPGQVDPLLANSAHLSVAPLDELAAVLARLELFVAADSGPMHLAAAAGCAVIGLFQATSPAAYAPLGQRCIALGAHALQPASVARETVRLATARS